jgi:hypothetical protein
MRRAPHDGPAPLATEGDQLVVAAVTAAQAQEAVGQDAAFEKSVELVLDELRQVGAGSRQLLWCTSLPPDVLAEVVAEI